MQSWKTKPIFITQIFEIYFSNQRKFNVRVALSKSTINRPVANFRQEEAVRNLLVPEDYDMSIHLTIFKWYGKVFLRIQKHQQGDVRHNFTCQEGRSSKFSISYHENISSLAYFMTYHKGDAKIALEFWLCFPLYFGVYIYALWMFPYKIQHVQESKPTYYQQRLDYTIYFQENLILFIT